MYSISTRPLSSMESERLRQSGRTSFFALISVSIVLPLAGLAFGSYFGLIVTPAITRILFEWPPAAIGVLGADHLAIGLAMSLIGLAFGVSWSVKACRWMIRGCQPARDDRLGGQAQVLHVVDPIVIRQDEWDDEGPILYMEIAPKVILSLVGPWLLDSETYGFPGDLPLTEGDRLNGLPDPFGFPSREFTLARAERSGVVLGIEVLGEYLEPSGRLAWKDVRPVDKESDVFPGEIEDIPAALSASAKGKAWVDRSLD